jgi:uncharacterized protein (DUF2147 family)
MRRFAENSMKIATDEFNDPLTTQAPRFAERALSPPTAAATHSWKNVWNFPSGTAFSFVERWISLRLRKGYRSGRGAVAQGGRNMLRKVSLALAATVMMTGAALADPIEGSWKTQSGETASIAGGGSFSITLKTGKYAGKTIGSLKAAGDSKYAGSITDPATDKTYSGKATITGSKMKMSGCVLGGLICKSQTWTKM